MSGWRPTLVVRRCCESGWFRYLTWLRECGGRELFRQAHASINRVLPLEHMHRAFGAVRVADHVPNLAARVRGRELFRRSHASIDGGLRLERMHRAADNTRKLVFRLTVRPVAKGGTCSRMCLKCFNRAANDTRELVFRLTVRTAA